MKLSSTAAEPLEHARRHVGIDLIAEETKVWV